MNKKFKFYIVFENPLGEIYSYLTDSYYFDQSELFELLFKCSKHKLLYTFKIKPK